MELIVKDVPAGQLKQKNLENLRFGELFTDRMFIMEYSPKKGWHDARIEAFHNFSVSPATMSFHYAQEIFEGMKAYAYKGDRVAMFRPMENLDRLNTSADRLCMPKIDTKFVLEALKKLVELEKGWVPKKHGNTLYIRPTMIGTDPIIKVKASEEYMFFIILSPVGPYFSGSNTMSKIMVEDNYVRAVRGGLGFAKTGANYAASIKAGMEASKKGYDQVLWLDGVERKYVQEVGAMNIFFVMNDTVVTPELDGAILPGITRKSVLDIAKKNDFKVEERRIAIDEVLNGLSSGKVTEVFGTGTACVINPVSTIGYKGKDYVVCKEPGKYAKLLLDELMGLQYGERPDPFGWMTIL